MPFIIAKKVETQEINLTKAKQHMYAENYKMLLRQIKDLNKWRDTLHP